MEGRAHSWLLSKLANPLQSSYPSKLAWYSFAPIWWCKWASKLVKKLIQHPELRNKISSTIKNASWIPSLSIPCKLRYAMCSGKTLAHLPTTEFFLWEAFFSLLMKCKETGTTEASARLSWISGKNTDRRNTGRGKKSVSSLDSVLRTPLIYHTRLWELGNKQLWNKEGAWLNSACSHVWSTANFPSQIHLHIHAHVLRSTSPCVWRVLWLAALLHSFLLDFCNCFCLCNFCCYLFFSTDSSTL